MKADKHFFDTVRPLFRGRLTQAQVDGMFKIVEYADKWGYSDLHTAYALATIKHETANWMAPIREGARRYGTNYTNAQAIRAVTSIFSKGIIRTNYALPAGPYKQSYYGRGLVQITWHGNYKQFDRLLNKPLEKNPDLALEWDTSLDIVFLGMRDGLFRKGNSLAMIKSAKDFKKARTIVNGDSAKRWGGTQRVDDKLAGYANVFLKALN